MRRLAVCLVLAFGACDHDKPIDTEPNASVDAALDATPHPDNGFGNPCTPMFNTQHLYTECKSLDGNTGVCVLNNSTPVDGDYACRRFCRDGCQPDQVQVSGVENICWCEPQT